MIPRFRNLGKVKVARRFEVAADSARSPGRTFHQKEEKCLNFIIFIKMKKVSTFCSKINFWGPTAKIAIGVTENGWFWGASFVKIRFGKKLSGKVKFP